MLEIAARLKRVCVRLELEGCELMLRGAWSGDE